jgi:hypothetical protein
MCGAVRQRSFSFVRSQIARNCRIQSMIEKPKNEARICVQLRAACYRPRSASRPWLAAGRARQGHPPLIRCRPRNPPSCAPGPTRTGQRLARSEISARSGSCWQCHVPSHLTNHLSAGCHIRQC